MECQSIQPAYFVFYLESIKYHCRSAMRSVDVVVKFIQMTNDAQGNYTVSADQCSKILDSLQNFILHCAAVARYFWPTHKGEEKQHHYRAKELRAYFQIDRASPLSNVTLRNQLEHFDENLDDYLGQQPIVGTVIPAYVGGRLDSNGVPVHYFRAFFIEDGIFRVLSNEYEIQPLVDEMQVLYEWLFKKNT